MYRFSPRPSVGKHSPSHHPGRGCRAQGRQHPRQAEHGGDGHHPASGRRAALEASAGAAKPHAGFNVQFADFYLRSWKMRLLRLWANSVIQFLYNHFYTMATYSALLANQTFKSAQKSNPKTLNWRHFTNHGAVGHHPDNYHQAEGRNTSSLHLFSFPSHLAMPPRTLQIKETGSHPHGEAALNTCP